jgi:hypothetical protein
VSRAAVQIGVEVCQTSALKAASDGALPSALRMAKPGGFSPRWKRGVRGNLRASSFHHSPRFLAGKDVFEAVGGGDAHAVAIHIDIDEEVVADHLTIVSNTSIHGTHAKLSSDVNRSATRSTSRLSVQPNSHTVVSSAIADLLLDTSEHEHWMRYATSLVRLRRRRRAFCPQTIPRPGPRASA